MGTLVINKDRITEVLSKMPNQVVIDDFIEQIIISAKLEKALAQFESGEFLTSEELDAEIDKW